MPQSEIAGEPAQRSYENIAVNAFTFIYSSGFVRSTPRHGSTATLRLIFTGDCCRRLVCHSPMQDWSCRKTMSVWPFPSAHHGSADDGGQLPDVLLWSLLNLLVVVVMTRRNRRGPTIRDSTGNSTKLLEARGKIRSDTAAIDAPRVDSNQQPFG